MTNNKTKKYFKAGLAAAVVVSSGAAVAPMVTQAQSNETISFTDLKKDHLFYNDIMNLAERGIVVGFPNGMYGAESQVTRGQAAIILAKILNLDTVNVTDPGFIDVPKNHSYYGAIAALHKEGIVVGYNNKFNMNNPLTRNEMAKIIARGFGLKSTKAAPFKDMNNLYKDDISALYENGVTKGISETIYDGKSIVTRGQMAAFAVRADEIKREITFEINNIENSKIVTSKGSFKTDLSIFNTENAAALEGAEVSAIISNGEIVSINSLTLNNSGTQEKPVTFDGGNAVIDGSLTINADYVVVKNLTVNTDVIITDVVENEVNTDQLTINGEIIIEDAKAPVASMRMMVANVSANGPKVNLANSSVKAINAQRNNIVIASDKKIPELKVASNVAAIKVDATVASVSVNGSESLQITGTGSIDKVNVAQATQLGLDVKGQVKELVVANKDAKVTIGTEAKIEKLIVPADSDPSTVIENYETVKENISEVVDDAGTVVDSSIVNVTTVDDLKLALADEKIQIINLANDISTTEKILVTRPVAINGHDHSIAFEGDATGWNSNYIMYVYNTEDVMIKNIKLSGGDAGLLVNSSKVKLTGTIDVSENEFGGIESSKSAGLETMPALDVTGATFVNTTEAYKLSTIWEDKVTGTVTGADALTKNDTVKPSQIQYYVKAENAVDPATIATVKDMTELKAALADTKVKTINLTANIENVSERIVVDREVTINGNNHTISFTDAINSLPSGSRHGILVSADDVTVNDLTVTLTDLAGWQGAYALQVYDAKNVVLKNFAGTAADAAILVNASDVELTGMTTVSGNEFGGIEVSKGTVAGLENSLLTVTGTLANTTEALGQPTIWLVVNQGEVTGNAPTIVDTEIKADQIQYYLNQF